MVAGQVVIMVGSYRSNAATLAVGEAGGQTWTTLTAITQGTNIVARAFICVFNGTWSANPSVTVTSGTNPLSVSLHVFAGVDNTTPQDATSVNTGIGTPGSPFDCVATGITTVTADALVFVHYTSEDNNTWAFQTASMTQPTGTQRRNGTTFSTSEGYKVFASPGATGTFSNRQATLGGDQAVAIVIALRPAAAGGSPPVVRGLLL